MNRRDFLITSGAALLWAGIGLRRTIAGENIKKQMAEQMEKNENIIYWMYSDDKTFWGFYEIAPDQNFYFNENNDLVIVFNKYEVAPGSMGYPEFIIPLELYEGNR